MSSACALRVTSEYSFTDLRRMDSRIDFRLAVINVSSACALRVTSEYSFTDLGKMDSRVDCWLVVRYSDDWSQTHASKKPSSSAKNI